MKGALGRLLHEVVDYAGLFPPARLGISESVENYLRYIQGPEKWIVGRFVCSASKLRDLARELAEHPEEPFFPVSVIGSASKNRHEWEHALSHDADEMNRFMEEADGHAEIETFEIRVPDHAHVAQYVVDLRGFTDVDVFVELPWAEQMDESLALVAETEMFGAKGRTGGLEAAAYPSSEALAGFLQQCAHLDLRFKLTAGLHHALPTRDPATGATMNGFLNVLCALALLHGHDYSRREVQLVLEDADPASFKFSDGIRWQKESATADDVAAVREIFASFGSCSVTEPLDDLKNLKLLGEAVGR